MDADELAFHLGRELDRMPDPTRNPCEAAEQEVERLSAALARRDDLIARLATWAETILASGREDDHPALSYYTIQVDKRDLSEGAALVAEARKAAP